MRALFLCTSLFLVLFATQAQAQPTLCIPAHRAAVLTVTFSTLWESGVKVVRMSDEKTLFRFNNYDDRGSVRDLSVGSAKGRIESRETKTCYRIAGLHKRGIPNRALPWRHSRFRIANGGSLIEFETAADDDFDDAVVSVRYAMRPNIRLSSICAAPMSALRFTVMFSTPWETGLKIVRSGGRDELRSFNNYYQRGAGDSWQQGSGVWVSPVEGNETCYDFVATYRKGTPDQALPWNAYKQVENLHSTRRYETADDVDYDDIVLKADLVYPEGPPKFTTP